MKSSILPKRSLRFLTLISIAIMTVGFAACSTTPPADMTVQAPDSTAQTPKLALAEDLTINGAGATFPAPLYQKWFQDLHKENPKLMINYQGVGSGAGVEQFTQKTVNFGASDVAMTDEEIAAVNGDVLMLPMTAGSIVLAYNVPGIEGELRLPREVYTDIFLGKITRWNDPAIAESNLDLNLPDLPITVVHRSDGSGTTGVFTKHLSAISPDWEKAVGSGKSVEWPTGIGAKGNEGVTAQLQQTAGAIGYVEYGYAKQNGLAMAALQNQAGEYIMPSERSAEKTLEAVQLPENLRAFISDPEGADSYPIVTYTWMLVHKHYDNPEQAKAIEAMVEYGLTKGQQESAALGYIPLPINVKEKVAAAAQDISPDYTLSLR
jgi:phosphate transport system substrate-binding protein